MKSGFWELLKPLVNGSTIDILMAFFWNLQQVKFEVFSVTFHGGSAHDPALVVDFAVNFLVEFKKVHGQLSVKKLSTTAPTKWSCPPSSIIKMNSDVAACPSSDFIGVGGVFRLK
ncbi:hypothetical protein PanWU01x14_341030 [Parasponia andersonii]|uniref:Uncharacterized protein n=1 Tax=Parasponia andersonii TaxID=3476 RepID=A0A2P5AE92_PARAD|nr:hypothetical protein PanWU01x14_341030 [Parasponia andersonii]